MDLLITFYISAPQTEAAETPPSWAVGNMVAGNHCCMCMICSLHQERRFYFSRTLPFTEYLFRTNPSPRAHDWNKLWKWEKEAISIYKMPGSKVLPKRKKIKKQFRRWYGLLSRKNLHVYESVRPISDSTLSIKDKTRRKFMLFAIRKGTRAFQTV